MEPEKEFSSSVQKPLSLWSLLGTLASAVAVWALSKSHTPNEQSHESSCPQDSADNQTYIRQNPSSLPLRIAIDSVPPPKPPTEEEKSEKEEDRRDKRLKTKLELGATAIALGLLGINILLWCSTEKAAQAAKDSVDLARKTAHFDQRAWLGISYGTYKYAVNEPFGVTFEVTDTGKTPARNVSGMAVTYFLKAGEPIPTFSYDHRTNVDLGTMLPGTKQSAISYLLPVGVPKEKSIQQLIVSDSMVRAIKDRTGYILVYGRLEYDSVFGAHHWMTFCASNVEFIQPKGCVDYSDVDNNEEP